MVYDVRLRESSPEIKIVSAAKALTLKLGLVGEAELELLPNGGTSIRDVSLIDMSVEGEWESALLEDGKLSYPDRLSVTPVTIAKSDLVGLAELSRFATTQLSLDPNGEGLRVRGWKGKARNVTQTYLACWPGNR